MSPHDSHPKANVRNPSKVILPPLDSAFDRLKMNSSRPSARYHSCGIEPLEVMALAGRLAGQDNADTNAVPSLPGSDSLLSEKKQKKSRSSFLSSNIARLGGVESSYILDVVTDVVATFCLHLDRQQTCVDHCCMSGSSRAVDCVTCAIYSRSRSLYATSQRHASLVTVM